MEVKFNDKHFFDKNSYSFDAQFKIYVLTDLKRSRWSDRMIARKAAEKETIRKVLKWIVTTQKSLKCIISVLLKQELVYTWSICFWFFDISWFNDEINS